MRLLSSTTLSIIPISRASCAVNIESSVITIVDEAELADTTAFVDNFESLLETALGLPDSTVEVTNITISSAGRSQPADITVVVEFTITLTDEELAEPNFEST